MPSSGNSRLIAHCGANIAGGIAAGAITTGSLASWPVALPLFAFFGLNKAVLLYAKRDEKEAADELNAILAKLIEAIQSDHADIDALLTDVFVGQQIESQDLRERLGFISEVVKHSADTTESIDARTGRIEQMLINHPDHTARFEYVLKEHYQALGGKLDENQQGIVFAAFGNDLLYLAVDELEQLQAEANQKLDDLQDGQEILKLDHQKTHEGLAELKHMIQAMSPQTDSASPDPAEADLVLERGLTRLAQDA